MTQTQSRKKNLFQMNVDLMHGPIFRSLVLFMLPILISNLFQQLYNTVDTMIVGNVLGDTAPCCHWLLRSHLRASGGLRPWHRQRPCHRGSARLRRSGRGPAQAHGGRVAGHRTGGVADHHHGGLFRPAALLELLDTPAEILEDAYRYIIIIDLGVIVMFAYNLCAGLLRAIGNSVMPLVFLLLSSALNVVLDLWFIAGMGMGVAGAAVATVIAQGVSVVLCILYVMARVRILIPGRKHLDVGRKLYWDLFSQSISMGLMSSIVSAGSVILQYGINGLGTLTIAGHTAARKLFAFTDMPLIAMANAASTFVSQNYGAGQPERIRKGMREIYLYSLVVMVVTVLLMQVSAEWLVRMVSGSSEALVLENGARYLRWTSPSMRCWGCCCPPAMPCRAWAKRCCRCFPVSSSSWARWCSCWCSSPALPTMR